MTPRRGADRRRVRMGVPRRTRRAQARQCSCLCRRPSHDGGRVRPQRRGGRRSACRRLAQRVGARILGAVEATSAAVGANTNLGIILLCAPLAAAAETAASDLRASLAEVLARPRYCGCRPRVSRHRPRLAGRSRTQRAPRRVRARYGQPQRGDGRGGRPRPHRAAICHRFCRCFRSRPASASKPPSSGTPMLRWATLTAYLGFLSAFPDSHIVRKLDAATADAVRRQAAALQTSLQAARASGPTSSRSSGVGRRTKGQTHQSRHQRRPDGGDAVRTSAADHLAVGTQQ